MKTFSQRIGIMKIKDVIQKDYIDDDLKNALWNVLTVFFWDKLKNSLITSNDFNISSLIDNIWLNFFKKRIDEKLILSAEFKFFIKTFFFSANWYEIYDLLEFIQENYYDPDEPEHNEHFMNFCNNALEKELSAYRFVNGKIMEITSQQEIESIEEATSIPDKFKPVKIHLNRAIELLSDKKNPDYRNSIKESISAIESMCSIITNSPKATLGQALKIIEKNKAIHSALKSSFSSLYGYTSDANGIRHSLFEESNLCQEDAKFMLVACSAFINYLKQKGNFETTSN